jgi:hypothetical protein
MNDWVFPIFSNLPTFGPINQIPEPEYQKVAREFCQYYHQLFDNNFPNLSQLYSNNPKITYFQNEYTSFDSLMSFIKNQGIFKFHHIGIAHKAQPLTKNSILIHISGKISVNNNLDYKNFSETVIIKKDSWNKYHITNSIFNLL